MPGARAWMGTEFNLSWSNQAGRQSIVPSCMSSLVGSLARPQHMAAHGSHGRYGPTTTQLPHEAKLVTSHSIEPSLQPNLPRFLLLAALKQPSHPCALLLSLIKNTAQHRIPHCTNASRRSPASTPTVQHPHRPIRPPSLAQQHIRLTTKSR